MIMARNPNAPRPKVIILEEVRLRAGLTQTVLSRALGVSRQTYANWLRNGRVNPANNYKIKVVGKALASAILAGQLPSKERQTPWEQIETVNRIVKRFALSDEAINDAENCDAT